MKKIFAIVLAILTMCFGTTVFASESGDTIGENESAEIDVSAVWSFFSNTPDVYSVDISWVSMTFTYSLEETKTWDAEKHSYDIASEKSWDKTSAAVTVTNHSNVSVSVSMEYIPENGTGITGSLSADSAVLNAGEEGNYSGADSFTAVLNISGEPNGIDSYGGEKIGTIKIIVS